MKICPLIISGKEIPLQEPTPLQMLAYMRGGSDVAHTYLLIAWIGDLGAASERLRGEPLKGYAERVLEELSWAPMMDIVRAADKCWGDAVRGSGIIPTEEDVDSVGKSSTETGATPSPAP